MSEVAKRTWLKPSATDLEQKKFNTVATISLNTEPATEDCAIGNGWYPDDGEVAGTEQKAVPEPAWLEEYRSKTKKKASGKAKDGEAKD